MALLGMGDSRVSLVLLVICVVLGSLGVLAQKVGDDNYSAAACCARGLRCWPRHARDSNLCKRGVWMSAQPSDCQRAACRYCWKNAMRRKMPVCRQISILKNCFGQKPPFRSPPQMPRYPMSPAPRPRTSPLSPTSPPSPPSPSKPSTCSFRAENGRTVIPASAFPVTGDWVRTRDNSGVIWKPSGGGGINPPEDGNPFCVRYTPDRTGYIYFTIISAAPHYTEHNDAWFRFPNGVQLYRPETNSRRNGGTGWLKGYENLGRSRVADYVLSIDHNGHQFITSGVKGKASTVCVAGRSTRYQIFKMVFVSCSSFSDCSRYTPTIKSALGNLRHSKCY